MSKISRRMEFPYAEVGKVTERYLAAVGDESRIRICFGPVKLHIGDAK